MATLPVALLDRILDETPGPRESVRREIRRLFDCRAPADSDRLPALLAWGVPAWQGLHGEDERALSDYCRRLRAAILRHEPRILALEVRVVARHHQSLEVHLDATLRGDDRPLIVDGLHLHTRRP